MTSFRADRGGLAAPVSATLFEGRAARTHAPGDALKYAWGDEHRDGAELQRICDQMVGVPVYSPHTKTMPAKDSGEKAAGYVVSARIDGEHLVVTVALTDEATIQKVRKGTRELSLGYMCDADENGYQHETRVDHLAIVPRARCGASCELRADCGDDDTCTCNSRAIVQTVGTTMSETAKTDAELDAKERHSLHGTQFAVPARRALPIEDQAHVEAAMSRFGEEQFQGPAEKRGAYHRIVGRAHELGMDPAGFVKKWGGRLDDKDDTTMDELTTKLTAALAEVATQTARADAAETAAREALAAKTAADVEATNARKDAEAEKARADAAIEAGKAAVEKARTDAATDLKTAIKTRVALETQATIVLGAAERSELSDRDIKVAVIKHVDGDDVPAEKPELYVDGVYEGAIKRHARTGKSHADARQTITQNRAAGATSTGLDAETAAKNAMNDHARNAWMTQE